MADLTPKQLLNLGKQRAAMNLPGGSPIVTNSAGQAGQVGTQAGRTIARRGAIESMARNVGGKLLPAAGGALAVAGAGEALGRAADDTFIGRSARAREAQGDAPVIGQWDEQSAVGTLLDKAFSRRAPQVQAPVTGQGPAVGQQGQTPSAAMVPLAAHAQNQVPMTPLPSHGGPVPDTNPRILQSGGRTLLTNLPTSQAAQTVKDGAGQTGFAQMGDNVVTTPTRNVDFTDRFKKIAALTPGEVGNMLVDERMAGKSYDIGPKDDGLGTSDLAGYVRNTRARRDDVRQEKFANDQTLAQMGNDAARDNELFRERLATLRQDSADARQDKREEGTNKRADDRLSLDRQKQSYDEMKDAFTVKTYDDLGEERTVIDTSGMQALQDRMAETGETDWRKARKSMEDDDFSATVASVKAMDPAVVRARIEAMTDPQKKQDLQAVYNAAFGQ